MAPVSSDQPAKKTFSASQLRAIADALGDTDEGLSGSEIGQLLASAKIQDVEPAITKRKRIFSALANSQNSTGDRISVLAFIRFAMKPETYIRKQDKFEPLRARLNRALLFAGLGVEASGKIVSVEAAETLGDARRRAKELRADLEIVGIHSEVLRFCQDELLADNYFHAVLEAAKSIAERLRELSGMSADGGALVDQVLNGTPPLIAINDWLTDNDKSEQRGFANLVKGVFGMFRNTTAHAPKITWAVNKSDAEQVFSLISMIHRRLDTIVRPPRG